MDSSIPFYKQLTSRFGALFTFFILSLIIVGSLLHFREQQIVSITDRQLPNLERLYHQQVLFNKIDHLGSVIINSEKLDNMLESHQTLLGHLTQLKMLVTRNKRALERIIYQQSSYNENINRLMENESRNELLLQSSLIQLQLVLDELMLKKADQQEKQSKLYQQITQDTVADKVTASRAKAYAKLTKSLELISQTHDAVANVHVLFNRIKLNYSLDDFDYVTSKLSETLLLWQEKISDINGANEADKKLLSLLMELQNLLFIEQSTIAKWRGHIRIAQEYFQSVENVKQSLNQRANQLVLPKTAINYVPQFISAFVLSLIHI